MSRTPRHRAPALSLLALGLLLVGCHSAGQPVAVPVQAGAPRYQHRLQLGFDVQCDVHEGRLRCWGEHPISPLDDDEADGWVSYGDGFSAAVPAGLGVCGLRGGRALCWGVSVDEQIEGLNERTCRPQTFSELRGIRELAMVDDGGCAITAERVATCWGLPLNLDDSDDIGLRDVAHGAHGLALGPYMGCVLTEGRLRCWGEVLGVGEEGDLPENGRTVDVPVPDPVQVVVGDGFACARSADRSVRCWGMDLYGNLGRGRIDEDPQPPTVIPGLAAVDLVGSETTVCARTVDGRSFCWGENEVGQLALGHTERVDTPTHVPALDGVVDLSLSSQLLCARFADGSVRCAGDHRPTGRGLTINRMGATQVPGVTATSLALHARALCVYGAQGTRCFGDATYGRGHLAAAAGWTFPGPADVHITAIASLHSERCLRFADGNVRCERDGTITRTAAGTRDLVAHPAHACFIDAGRGLQCWAPTRTDDPFTPVAGLTDVATAHLESRRGCAVTGAGSLRCWDFGAPDPNRPAGPTTDLSDLRAVALAGERTCVLRRAGQLVCWDGASPQTGEIDGVTQLAANTRGFLVVRAGAVYPLTIASGTVRLDAPIAGLTDVVELQATNQYACARTAAGAVYCWGNNDFSQFGVPLPSMQLALTPLLDVERAPEERAMLECGAAPDEDYEDYDDEDYDGYDETAAGAYAP
ncbi:MAG: hypothetical protein R3B40_13865 [Polyangiales bacterium]